MADRKTITVRESALVQIPSGVKIGTYVAALIEEHSRQIERAIAVVRHHRLGRDDVERLAELAELDRSSRMSAEEAASVIAEAERLGRIVEIPTSQEGVNETP